MFDDVVQHLRLELRHHTRQVRRAQDAIEQATPIAGVFSGNASAARGVEIFWRVRNCIESWRTETDCFLLDTRRTKEMGAKNGPQSGSFPLAAALLNPAVARGLVLVEPGGRPPNYTDEQLKTLAALPILIVFGDYRDTPTGLPTFPTWQARFEGCQAMIGRITKAGGQAEMLAPPDRGIRGNSHMIMQDKNHLQIADFILQWIDERVTKRTGARK